MDNIHVSIVTQEWHTSTRLVISRDILILYGINSKGISNILSLGLVQKNYPATYNSWDVNDFIIHSPQRPKFRMTKAGLFYHDMKHLLNNKDAHIMVNNLHSPIPQVQDKKEKYTARGIKRADCAKQFQHITGQPINRILHAVDNNILQNLSILQ